jgi:type III secretion protein U
LSGSAVDVLRGLWQLSTSADMFRHADERWSEALAHTGMLLIVVCSVVCGVAALAAVAGSFVQVGALAAFSRLAPDAKHMNPGEGLQRMVSMRNLINLVKLLLKTALLGGLLWAVIRGHLGTALRIGHLSPAGQMATIGQVLLSTLSWAAVIYAATAAVDYLHQRFEFTKRHRMSIDDLKREHQETEGSPLTQSRRRSAHLESVYSSVEDRVRAASLVVHSRTVAVALQYLNGADLPRVMAVGQGRVAEQICRLAQEQSLYVELNPELASQLHRDAPADRVVPRTLAEPLSQLLRRAQGLE